MKRTMIATSNDGQYTYWLDSGDLYVYQRKEEAGEWLGWLCALSAWDATFSKSATFGPYTDCSAALDKWVALKSRGWRVQPARAIETDSRGMGLKWTFEAWAPDAAVLAGERCVPHFQLIAA